MVEAAQRMLTTDAFFNGNLTIYQEKEGYRFSIDAVLLAGLTKVHPDDRILDLGMGCGIVPLILAYRGRGRELTGVEIQPELAALARRNIEANGYEDRIQLHELDYRDFAGRLSPESFDLVLSNPPYRHSNSGRINPHPQRAIARHEITGSIEDIFAAGKVLLPQGGRAAVIYPASRLDHLLVNAHRYGFSPKRLTVIHSHMTSPGRLVHVELRKGGGSELAVTRPFFIYRQDGAYTEAMRALYEG